MIDAIRKFWRRVTKPQRFTDQLLHDAGHAVTALLVTVGLWTWFGLPPGLSVFLGWVIPVGLIEGIKDFRRERGFFSRDSAHDVATYLPLQALWVMGNGDIYGGVGFLVAIASSFFVFYHHAFEQRWGKTAR